MRTAKNLSIHAEAHAISAYRIVDFIDERENTDLTARMGRLIRDLTDCIAHDPLLMFRLTGTCMLPIRIELHSHDRRSVFYLQIFGLLNYIPTCPNI